MADNVFGDQFRLNRRDLLRRAAVLGLSSSAVAAFLAACGGSSPTATSAPSAAASSAAASSAAASSAAASTAPSAAGSSAATSPAAAASAAATPGASAAGTPRASAAAGSILVPTVPPGKRGGAIIIGTLGEANNINPFLLSETEGTWRARMLFGQVVKLKPDTFEVIPGIAKSWKVDGLNFTFTLQDNAKFSDGSPVTADDIVFTMKGFLAKTTGSTLRTRLTSIQGAQAYYDGTATDVAGLKVIDPKTFVVTLAQPDASFLGNMRFVLPLPKKSLEGKDLTKDSFFQNPIGAGPFKFVSWNVGGDFVADRNPNYYEQGLPYLDKFTHRTIPDSQALVNALLSGDIDASNYPSPAGAKQLQANTSLNVLVPPFTNPDGWEFNFKNPYLAKKEVRQAIAMALNMDQFAIDSLYGLGKKGVGPIAPGNAFYDKDLKPIAFDLDKAKSLIQQAGAPPAEIQFMVNRGNVLREDFLTYTQAQLEKIGIKVKAEVIEFAQLIERRTKKDFEVNGVVSGAVVDPNDLALQYASTGSGNYNNYTNPKLDDLFVKAKQELDPEKAKPLWKEVQGIIMDELPTFYAWYRPFLHVTKKTFTGYVDSTDTGGLFYELERWSMV